MLYKSIIRAIHFSVSIVISSPGVKHNSSWFAGLTNGRTVLHRYCCRSSVRPGGIIFSGSSVASKGVAPLFLIDIGLSSPSISSFKYNVKGSSVVTQKWWNRLISFTARKSLDNFFSQLLDFQSPLWKGQLSFRMRANPLSTRHIK